MESMLAHRIIGILWGITGVYWIALAFGNKKTIVRPGRRLVWAYLLLFIIAFAISSQRNLRVHLYAISPATELLGVVLCAAGMALAIWARHILGRNWSAIAVIKQDHELIERGPYRYVRHPIYTGLIMALMGTTVALFPTLKAFLILLVWITGFCMKARSEERILALEFGENYAAYKQRVKAALIPFLL